jgi:hypothetical protein
MQWFEVRAFWFESRIGINSNCVTIMQVACRNSFRTNVAAYSDNWFAGVCTCIILTSLS